MSQRQKQQEARGKRSQGIREHQSISSLLHQVRCTGIASWPIDLWRLVRKPEHGWHKPNRTSDTNCQQPLSHADMIPAIQIMFSEAQGQQTGTSANSPSLVTMATIRSWWSLPSRSEDAGNASTTRSLWNSSSSTKWTSTDFVEISLHSLTRRTKAAHPKISPTIQPSTKP